MSSVSESQKAGARERDTRTIAIRSRDGEDLGTLPLQEALSLLAREVQGPDEAARAGLQEQLRQSLERAAI
uniref:threonyl-tRNA synthetase n=1 Tax=Microbulbifer agarilyticus TaxID=260552 RepID=UPI000255B918|nr:threonyl-tRNA synthetase [Microbulbifer agarilyticus]